MAKDKVIKEIIFDVATGEETVIYATDEDIAEQEARKIENDRIKAEELAKAEAEAQAKAEAKASALAKLAALGLTEEETNALIS